MASAFTARRVLAALLGLLCLLTPGAARAQSRAVETLCHAPDQTSSRTIDDLRRLLSSADSEAVHTRREASVVYQPTGTVSQVTDEPVCDQAIRALNERAKTTEKRRQVYVYYLGSQYAVEDPEQRASEYRMIRIFDLEWMLSGDVFLYYD
jgi:hypothetical protein